MKKLLLSTAVLIRSGEHAGLSGNDFNQRKSKESRRGPKNSQLECPGREKNSKVTKAAATVRNADQDRIKKMYRIVHQRDPSPRQLNEALQFVASAPPETQQEERKGPSAWKYGYAEVDFQAKQLKGFEPLPHFTGDAWQGGKNWPDEKLGWAQLTGTGGHAGNDMKHAVVRRWVAMTNGAVAIEGAVKHEHKEGDGIRAYIFSSRDYNSHPGTFKNGYLRVGRWNYKAGASDPNGKIIKATMVSAFEKLLDEGALHGRPCRPIERLIDAVRPARLFDARHAPEILPDAPPELTEH